jgi:hypothetical protein
MLRVLKTLLIWILIAGLPLQGMAAAIKASCGPAHHHDLHASAVHSHAAHSHHHESEGRQGNAGQDASPATMAGDGPVTVHGAGDSSYCSACAACCVGACAPPAAIVLPSLHDLSERVLTLPSHIASGFVPGGLERPPKSPSP